MTFLEARDFLLRHRTEYEIAYRGFRWPRLEEFNWALDYFDPMARHNSRIGLWIVDDSGAETRLTFAELAERSNRVANFLRGAGVRRGDRVLLMLGNEAALWDALLACFKLGAVVIPSSVLLGPDDLRDRLERGAVRHVIAGETHVEKFASLGGGFTRIAAGGRAAVETASIAGWHSFEDAYEAPTQFQADGPTRAADPLLLYFTSGTTAQPKLVLHSHESYPVGHLSTLYWLGLQPGDVHWNISSPGWAKHAWSCVFAPWAAGACVFVYNYARFDARKTLGLLRDLPITTICAPPTVWRMLVQEDLAAYRTSLRELASAGEPLNPEVIAEVRTAWGATIREGYGQTETTALIATSPGMEVKPGSMGRPMPGYAIALLNGGEVCVETSPRPAGLMIGYGATDGTFPDPSRNGSYHTADIASCDADGYFTYVGRTDDVFKSSDYRVSPFELESALIEHAAVAEAAVVPAPDPRRGCVPKAFIVLAPGYEPSAETARDIFAFLRRNLAPYKRIRRIQFAELPKTISGKIRRGELRRAEEARAAERPPLEFFEEDFTQAAVVPK
jgi:acetyl-CoA synthetase